MKPIQENEDFRVWLRNLEVVSQQGASTREACERLTAIINQHMATAVKEVQDDAGRYRHIKSKSFRDGQHGGHWGYYVLPRFFGWDQTPYAQRRGQVYDHVTLDAAVDADMGGAP